MLRDVGAASNGKDRGAEQLKGGGVRERGGKKTTQAMPDDTHAKNKCYIHLFRSKYSTSTFLNVP